MNYKNMTEKEFTLFEILALIPSTVKLCPELEMVRKRIKREVHSIRVKTGIQSSKINKENKIIKNEEKITTKNQN